MLKLVYSHKRRARKLLSKILLLCSRGRKSVSAIGKVLGLSMIPRTNSSLRGLQKLYPANGCELHHYTQQFVS